jgi:glycosyltransferase involved in cell wall biosynthesis
MRILIATDAWTPQINGVVRTLSELRAASQAQGAILSFLTPEAFPTLPLPTYRDIRLALPLPGVIERHIRAVKPHAIHIATEGPIGLLVRRYCGKHRLAFTTSFHTRFPDYISARLPIPESWVWAWLRWFHCGGHAVMAATPSLAEELTARGFPNVRLWPRGVDTELFRPRADAEIGLPRPIFLSVGRVAVEKNLREFLSLDLPGTKVVVGDGPDRQMLAEQFPKAVFLGAKSGTALAEIYSAADVFVFPSRTDTFGLVLLEALASGLPIAALPVSAPRDVIGHAPVGVLDCDLRHACLEALNLSREACRTFAQSMTWDESARRFLSHIRKVAGRSPTTPPVSRRAPLTPHGPHTADIDAVAQRPS